MTVKEFMAKSGCNITSRCYEYLPMALEIASEAPDMSLSVICEKVANEREVTHKAVSKALDRLVKGSYQNMDADIKKAVFNNREKVTTAKYIRGVSNAIRNGII